MIKCLFGLLIFLLFSFYSSDAQDISGRVNGPEYSGKSLAGLSVYSFDSDGKAMFKTYTGIAASGLRTSRMASKHRYVEPGPINPSFFCCIKERPKLV